MDLLLHPLKSELNFPIGQKHPLDFSPERWQCAIHGLDAIFFHASKAMSVPFHQSGRAHAILDELSTIIDAGFDEQQLQRSPHLVLLSPEWYQLNLKPVMAKWMPPSLLEQSRETLRATFSSIVKKRIYTLNYDRSSDMTWATVQKLRAARRHCGVLLCSASTIKSVELKLLEALDTLADPRRVQSLSSERQVKTIKGALDIFATGVLVMDEVVCEV